MRELEEAHSISKMIHDSATHIRIKFEALLQTDLVLLIRPFILDPKAQIRWYSRLAGRSQAYGPLDVFARANTSKGQPAIRGLFGVKDALDLVRKMTLAFRNESFARYVNAERFHFGYSLEQLLNWEELKHLLTQ